MYSLGHILLISESSFAVLNFWFSSLHPILWSITSEQIPQGSGINPDVNDFTFSIAFSYICKLISYFQLEKNTILIGMVNHVVFLLCFLLIVVSPWLSNVISKLVAYYRQSVQTCKIYTVEQWIKSWKLKHWKLKETEVVFGVFIAVLNSCSRSTINNTSMLPMQCCSGVIFRSNFYFPTGQAKNCLSLNYLNCQG